MSSENTVYLNGQFLPADQAQVSVLDRGFIFGEGVYEVIPVYGGHALKIEHHLQRLNDSLDGIRLANPLTKQQWRDMLAKLIDANNGGDLSVYIQVTRGAAPRDHVMPETTTPTVFAMATPLKPVPTHLFKEGAKAITSADIRWQYCHIKSTSLLANTLLRQQARDAGADEAILIRDGEVTEGAASSVFIVRDGVLLTPPKGNAILPGITRDIVLEVAQQAGIDCRERAFTEADLRTADEVWVTSSLREIVPVTTLDDAPVGDGKPGPLWQQVLRLYQDYKQQVRDGIVI